MIKAATLLSNMKDRPALPAFLWVATFIVLLCLAFNPTWETNDDVAMSMIAHGYGLAAYGSPYLVFSNVLWGYLVRAMPTINGVLGYSLATMSALLVFGWATLYFLLRLGAGYRNSLLAVALLLILPTLTPQFTVNAGLLTVAAVIGWQVYARLGGVGNLAVACLLAFIGYLIRGAEFFLVLGVALPLLPWRALRERRQMQAAFLLLGAAVAAAAAFDYWSYTGPEWRHFSELNSVRIPFTDFDAGEHLKKNPEIMVRHGYSKNDIDLVSSWFLVDAQIAAPESLSAMLAELGPIPMQGGGIQSGFTAIKALGDWMLLPIILPALVLFFVLLPGRMVALAWVFCLVALFALGVMGRPGILRIYVPLLDLLLIAPIMLGKFRADAKRWVVTLTLFAACVGSAYALIPEALESKKLTQQAQADIHDFPLGPVVTWAFSYPFYFTFPVLDNDPNARNILFYGLDSFTHAPFSVAAAEQKAGRGMIQRLHTAEGVPIIAFDFFIDNLQIYCNERLNGQLRGFITHQTSGVPVRQVRCEADE